MENLTNSLSQTTVLNFNLNNATTTYKDNRHNTANKQHLNPHMTLYIIKKASRRAGLEK